MIRLSRTLAAFVLIAVGLGAQAGCSSADTALDGTRWRLSSWTLDSLNPADFTITAEFDGERISGNSGVNTYGGPYSLGPGATFSAGPLSSTLMAGPEPAMRAEGAYLTLLGQAESFKAEGSVLTLYDGAGNGSLIFESTAT